ncbi:DUF1156 domain-containing protein [Corynebacterium pseudodiphtheriticum]|uniref:DUF1156 domain-containing protein n=1 Tax=Corynebacterium pseudodiphtheriticum TaxID=37637 RepID=UPI002542F1DF|nr:DUF1156 domain-containing protein [Corynebacterium pseudodiphtheriticum]MDK4249927.1 DUF1156 domain-containing protein [Corynebacterium pseudodiphtheriticum]MDK4318246.1 DUF1156 domain-containing protein [Corynebacterium pseudodiphtheriticum]
MTSAAPKKKLIEVSLPLDAINEQASREKSIRHGHPSTLHLYWARRPLATSRAVLFAQLVDDPSSHPDKFPTVEEQEIERRRLHALMERLVIWENSNDEDLLKQAQQEIRNSNNGELPAVLDPFAGGGSIPLEAQRLGLEAHASDLNPVAVLINKALIEIPPKFAGQAPVFQPDDGSSDGSFEKLRSQGWERAAGLAKDVELYGQWMLEKARERIGHLYPTIKDDDGVERTVIAWIWARTVTNPNPANPIEVPLVRSWWLSKKKGKEAWIEAKVVNGEVHYTVRHNAYGPKGEKDGTRNKRQATSLADGTPMTTDYLKSEGRTGRMGSHLLAIVAEGDRGRIYLSPTHEHISRAETPTPKNIPNESLAYDPRNFWTPSYGLTKFSDLFTNRQLTALTTLSDLVSEVRDKVLSDARAAGFTDGARLEDGGSGAEAYADAVATLLGFAVSRTTDRNSSLASWDSSRSAIRNAFGRQALPMVWDFAEANPLSDSSGSFSSQLGYIAKSIQHAPTSTSGKAVQADAATREYGNFVISTDPPYYDNIGYSDLSDYFYVWLRRSLRDIHPETVATMLTPKEEELVANPYRHNGKQGAEQFFVKGFNSVFARIRKTAAAGAPPLTVYYAYKQQDTRDDGTASTGWHTLLDGLIASGWEITATWPLHTETKNRLIASGTNALASSIVLACRPRPESARAITRRDFIRMLKSELPAALRALMSGNVAPVDLAQASIGPGISIFSRYSSVRNADGTDMTVREALSLINTTLDEVLGEQESDFDPDTRFSVKWYRQYGWTPAQSGVADQLARAANTTLGSLERGGIFEAKGGKARLLSPQTLDEDWDPNTDEHISVWESTVRLAAVLYSGGAEEVAKRLPAISERVSPEAIKELAFLLFHEAEKKKDTKDAGLFNALVSAWPDLMHQARAYDPAQAHVQDRAGQQDTLDF